jgi:hypothetical protein
MKESELAGTAPSRLDVSNIDGAGWLTSDSIISHGTIEF